MLSYKRISWFLSVLTLAGAANASTLTFAPQPDSIPGTTNYSWFSAANWFVADGSGDIVPAGRIPQANDTALVTGLADAEAAGIRVKSLLLTNNAAVSNGTFSVENLQMLSGSSFNTSTINTLVLLNIGGMNCSLSNAVLNILAFASATMSPVSPATTASLVLAEGATLQDFGSLTLADGSQIVSGATPRSTLVISPGGVLSSSGTNYVRGSPSGPLLVDNSGVIRVDDGTLHFDNGLDWRCSSGTGEFRAASTNSLIAFDTGFHADSGTTSLFTGPGTNIWYGGGTIDGTAQVGALDPNSQAFSPGNLNLPASCSGLGNLHILGSPAQSAVLNWNNGNLSLAAVNVDRNATMLITGGSGSSRQLSGCALNNSGTCTFMSCDLVLAQGSALQNFGTLILASGSQIIGGPSPDSTLRISSGAVLSSTGLSYIQGSASGPLLVDNSGLIRVDDGTLHFDNLLDWRCSSGTGEFRANSTNALIAFDTSFHADSGTTSLFTGPGTNIWYGGGTIDGTAQVGSRDPNTQAFSPGNLILPASCSGLGNLHILGSPDQSAMLNWGNGNLSLAAINVDPNGTLLITGGNGTSRQLSGAALNNSGICTMVTGDLALAQGAAINNLSGGTVDIQSDAAITSSIPGQLLYINNAGSFVKSGGTGMTVIAVNLNNSGNLEVKTGTLDFQGSWSQTQGSTTVESGSVLSATLLNVEGGILGGGGTIKAKVTNNGIASPGGSPGILSLGPGDDYEQLTNGTLQVEIGGHTAGTQYDQLVVEGNASLAGVLELHLINGFVPQIGDRFQILACSSLTGEFSEIIAPNVSGATWVAQSTGTAVFAVLATAVALEQPRLSQGVFSFSFHTAPGFSYVVQRTVNLRPSNWKTYATISGDGNLHTVSNQTTNTQSFFRVLIQ